MAKQAVMDYSTTAASNTDIDGLDSTGATGLESIGAALGDNSPVSTLRRYVGLQRVQGVVDLVTDADTTRE